MGSSSSNKTTFEISGTLLATECCLEADPQSCISCLLRHEQDMLSSNGRDPPAGRDEALEGLGRRAACHELIHVCAGLLGHSSLWWV